MISVAGQQKQPFGVAGLSGNIASIVIDIGLTIGEILITNYVHDTINAAKTKNQIRQTTSGKTLGNNNRKYRFRNKYNQTYNSKNRRWSKKRRRSPYDHPKFFKYRR